MTLRRAPSIGPPTSPQMSLSSRRGRTRSPGRRRTIPAGSGPRERLAGAEEEDGLTQGPGPAAGRKLPEPNMNFSLPVVAVQAPADGRNRQGAQIGRAHG